MTTAVVNPIKISIPPPPLADLFPHENGPMIDKYGRRINYMRISLTDACNLRCVYCMPEDIHFRPRAELLQDDEVLLIVRAAAELGVNKIRLTGGEPTIRRGVVDLVREIAAVPGIRDLAMTTNGLLLDKLAQPLVDAGLKRVNISVDTLNPEKFRRITRWGDLEQVWAGIVAAEEAGLRPVKLNCVVTRGYNDDEVVDLAALTLEKDWEVRFIELMPFGSIADFARDSVVSWRETQALVEETFGALEEIPGYDMRDPSRPFRIPGARGNVGFISTVTEPFCAGCGRVRVTADGKLRLCLLRDDEVDLLTPIRAGCSYEELKALLLRGAWHKPWGHGLPEGTIPKLRVMSQIGG